MFAALVLALAPLPFTALGSPCVCFPIQHAGTSTIPDDPLGKAGWTHKRLLDETLRTVRGTDDVFLRADTLRNAVRVLGSADAKSDADSALASRTTLIKELSLDLKREAELAPHSHASLELTGDLDAARARLQALPGVVRVEPAPAKTNTLSLWFDAQKLSAQRLQETSGAAAAPTIEPPTNRGRALAAITLAFAVQSSREQGHETDIDPRALARDAVSFQPKDARIALIAGMVWFDGDSHSSARFVREAIRNGQKDEYVTKNLVSIFGAFYGTRDVEELTKKLDRELEKG